MSWKTDKNKGTWNFNITCLLSQFSAVDFFLALRNGFYSWMENIRDEKLMKNKEVQNFNYILTFFFPASQFSTMDFFWLWELISIHTKRKKIIKLSQIKSAIWLYSNISLIYFSIFCNIYFSPALSTFRNGKQGPAWPQTLHVSTLYYNTSGESTWLQSTITVWIFLCTHPLLKAQWRLI